MQKYLTKTIFAILTFCLLLFSNSVFSGLNLNGLQVARDINPDPNIVEVHIEAIESEVELTPGVISKVYTYNGSIPGPLIKAKVGDTLIVHFQNNLPEPTTVHWHGMRTPAAMDGSNLAQKLIPPGGTFRYEFKLKDASLFWYHPHVRSYEQVEKGLAAPLLVLENDKKILNRLPFLQTIEQSVLVLDDILLDRDGQVVEPFSGTPTQVLHKKIDGREGNTLLVNGQKLPTINVTSGVPVRWRLVNTANSRFMTLHIPGHTLTRIGGDGGLMEKAKTKLKQIKIVTGERADIIFTPIGKPGSEIIVYWKDAARGRHAFRIENGQVIMSHSSDDGKRPKIPMMKLKFIDITTDKNAQKITLPPILRQIEKLNTESATVTRLEFAHGVPTTDGEVKFTIDSNSTLSAAVGEVQIWDLVNKSIGDHPFHLHGFYFQVLGTIKKDKAGNETDTIARPILEYKDVVNIPGAADRNGSTTTVRIAIKFDQGDPKATDIIAYGGFNAIDAKPGSEAKKPHSGGWLFHCQMLEHVNLGMVSYLELRDQSTYKPAIKDSQTDQKNNNNTKPKHVHPPRTQPKHVKKNDRPKRHDHDRLSPPSSPPPRWRDRNPGGVRPPRGDSPENVF